MSGIVSNTYVLLVCQILTIILLKIIHCIFILFNFRSENTILTLIISVFYFVPCFILSSRKFFPNKNDKEINFTFIYFFAILFISFFLFLVFFFGCYFLLPQILQVLHYPLVSSLPLRTGSSVDLRKNVFTNIINKRTK